MKKILISFLIILCLISPLMAQTSVHNRQLSDTPSLATVNGLIAAATASVQVNQTVSVLAGENLSSGDVVSIINQKAYKNALTVSQFPNGAESVFASAATAYVSACTLDSTRFLTTYGISTNLYSPQFKVGTVSGSSISWGLPAIHLRL